MQQVVEFFQPELNFTKRKLKANDIKIKVVKLSKRHQIDPPQLHVLLQPNRVHILATFQNFNY